MPWMLLVLTVGGTLSTSARAPVLTRPLAVPPVLASCPSVVTASVVPPRPYRPGSAMAVPIPTHVDARLCPIPLAGTSPFVER